MRGRHELLVLAFGLFFAVFGCGPTSVGTRDGPAPPTPDGGNPLPDGNTGGDGGGPGPDAGSPPGSALHVMPEDAVLVVAPGATASLDYRVILRSPGTYDLDVTAEASLWLDDTTLGSLTGTHFAGLPDATGSTVVHAAARGLEGQTSLTLAVQSELVAPGAPADAPGKFGGADDPSRSPTIVYPPDGVLLPPNLTVFEFHFLPGTGNTLFALTFEQGAIALTIYFGCTPLGSGCVYALDQTAWSFLAESMRGREAVTYTLRGVDGASPGAVGTSASQTIMFADRNITGGIYYWNAAGTVQRYEFGVSGQSAETYLDRARAGATTCVGCHVVSNDGRRIAVGVDIPSPSPYRVFDVATRSLIYAQGNMIGGGANFFSFSPDASQILTSNGVSTVWRDATTGAAILNPLIAKGTMPDWAPDGSKLVYAKPETTNPIAAAGVDKAGLETMPYNGTQWGASTPLVPYAGQNNYYPSFSADGQWVVFNRSPSDVNSYDAPDAEVWVVAAGGGTPLKLARASTGGDSWPKWAPAEQTYRGSPIMWLTFSSRRAYGLRLEAGTRAQIWMTAFDPARAAAGQDPSYPAFWLPFQNLGSGNHIAQWVTTVVRQPCVSDGECASGEFCEGGRCVPTID